MSIPQFNQVLRRFESSFRGYFTQITDDDMGRLLDGPREALLMYATTSDTASPQPIGFAGFAGFAGSRG